MLNDVFALVEEGRDRADENRLAIFRSFVKIVYPNKRQRCCCGCVLVSGAKTDCVNPLYVMETLWTMWKKISVCFSSGKHFTLIYTPLFSSAQCHGEMDESRQKSGCALWLLFGWSLSLLSVVLFFSGEWDSEGEKERQRAHVLVHLPVVCVVPHEFPATRSLPSHTTPSSRMNCWLFSHYIASRPLAGITIPFSHSNSPQYLIVYFMGQWDFPQLGLFAPLSLLSLGSVKIKHGW